MARLLLNRLEVVRTAQRTGTKKVDRCLRVGIGIAKATAPRGRGGSSGRVRLRPSLGIVGPKATASKVEGKGGSNLKYAASVSKGARPHAIKAKRARALRFYWNRVGHVVNFPQVNHPGQRPNRYLQRAFKVAARLNGFRYSDSATK